MGSDPLIGTILAERYRIVAPIGRGGAGTVYRGIQLQLDREVAIKVVRPDVSDETRAELQARFYREASLAGRLSHPAIVQTIDYGTTESGQQFVVMELLVGRTLRDALRQGPLPAAEAARIGAELARGLHHAHARGLIHRDVKASNVLLIRDEEGVEHPKLLDFGLVKSVERELDVTQTPTYLGTPLYMSPEQARGSTDLDGRTDQYSLGCLLYCMCTGVMPFVGETPMATALLHMSEPYPPMRERAPEVQVDPELEAIVRRAMSREPEARFDDAAALARALEEWGRQPAASAARPSAVARFATIGAAAILGGVALVLVAGGLAFTMLVGLVFLGTPLDNTYDPTKAAPPSGLHGQGGAGAPSLAGQSAPVAPDSPSEHMSSEPMDPEPADVEPTEAAPSPIPAEAPPAPRPATPAPKPPADPPPTASPAPAPESAPQPDELERPITVDGVTFTRRSEMSAVLRFANGATRDQLIGAGIFERYGNVDTVIDNRPYRSVQQLGATKGIGPDTMKKLHAAASAAP